MGSQGRRVVIAGDSAGGFLAVEVLLRAISKVVAKKTPSRGFVGAVGFCPWFDIELNSLSHRRNEARDLLHRHWLQKGVREYMRHVGLAGRGDILNSNTESAALAALWSGAILLVRCL